MKKILIIEDEKNLAESLKIILETEGFEVETTEFGQKGYEIFLQFDLLILDLMLPDGDGLDVLGKIRLVDQKYPVIIVSAKAEEEDLIRGLSSGADDYLTKPFLVRELVLKIKRTFERKALYEKVANEKKVYAIGEHCSVNFSNLVAMTLDGEKKLTTQEASLLEYLLQNKNRIVSRGELIEKIWGTSSEIETRTVDNFIVRFRKYFEKNPQRPLHFMTKRGIGYSFEE